METEIKKIVLQLGEKEVTLTVAQCKKLKELLGEMFGKEVIREVYHDNNWYWNRPHYLGRPYYIGEPILCSSSAGGFKAGFANAMYSNSTLSLKV